MASAGIKNGIATIKTSFVGFVSLCACMDLGGTEAFVKRDHWVSVAACVIAGFVLGAELVPSLWMVSPASI